MLPINSLCRNKIPGLFDCTKNAVIETAMITSQTDNTSIVCKIHISFSFQCSAFCCNESKELKGMDIQEEMGQDQYQFLILPPG